MKIGHSGHTRVEELILAFVLLVVALRTALPLGSAVYVNTALKITFAILIALPALFLLKAHTLLQRKRALLAVFITYGYITILTVVVDPARFGVAGLSLGLGAVAAYLYFVARLEIKTWGQENSSQS
jgi:hypothetical protein